MKLEEAVQLFDRQLPLDTAWLVIGGVRIGVPYCCHSPVVEKSKEGFARLYCLECGREIRQLGRQWVVTDWGRKGISFLGLNAALTVEASREMARSSVPDNLEKAAAPASLGGDERRRFDQIEHYVKYWDEDAIIGGWLPDETWEDVPTWGDVVALARSQRELEGEVERLRGLLSELLPITDDVPGVDARPYRDIAERCRAALVRKP